jgi:hypothetical protein
MGRKNGPIAASRRRKSRKDRGLAGINSAQVHADITNEMRKLGVKPRTSGERSYEDPIERFRRIPLHAVFLYSPEDGAIDHYVKEHWSSLDRVSADYCDIHPFLSQVEGKEDVYDFINGLDVIRESSFDALSELPGIFFWTLESDYFFVSLKDFDGAQLVNAIRVIFEEIRRHPSIDAVRNAHSRLQKEKGMIDLLAASQIASIAGNAVSIIDKMYTQFVAFAKKEGDVEPHPPSICIQDAPLSDALETKKTDGKVLQRITYTELAAKLDPSDLTYIRAREKSLRNYQAQWEAIYPDLSASSSDERARLNIKLKNIAQDMSSDLSAILGFLEKRLGVFLDDHYLAVRDIAETYHRTSPKGLG